MCWGSYVAPIKNVFFGGIYHMEHNCQTDITMVCILDRENDRPFK